MARSIVTAERVLEVLDFSTDPPSWRVSRCNRARVGGVAGTLVKGYRHICIDRRVYGLHRLVWLIHTGRFPPGEIDHINNDKLDNRIENLRDVTRTVNAQNKVRAQTNNKSGLLGVSPSGNRWKSCIQLRGKTHNLGTFAAPEEAHSAYLEAKRRLHPGCTI